MASRSPRSLKFTQARCSRGKACRVVTAPQDLISAACSLGLVETGSNGGSRDQPAQHSVRRKVTSFQSHASCVTT